MTGARYTIPFDEIGLDELELVGGKSAHLGDLRAAGFPVPAGFAVTTRAFDQSSVPAGVEPREARRLVVTRPIPEAVEESIVSAYARLGDGLPVAVRSSAVAEDGAEASFAGVQDTYLWVRGADEVTRAVRRCFASYFNDEAVSYRGGHSETAPGMSVAVQLMVDARVAGVMFTLNPVSGDPSCVAIDASYGLGTTVVGGDVTPDSFLVSKVTREIARSVIGEKAVECVADAELGATVVREVERERRERPSLEPDEVLRLAELARAVERHYGCAQDLEWAIDRRTGDVVLLQSRAETVWSRKPRERPAVAANPVAAIAATFLGHREKRGR
jgi:phosphoenolpyruvate synthase/pyruvate phosphate dikinase